MIYPENIEEKLGFSIIRERLKSYCFSDSGKSLVDEIKFSSNPALISLLLGQVDEFKLLLIRGDIPPLRFFESIEQQILRSAVEGNWLSAKELYEVYNCIDTALEVSEFILASANDCKLLQNLTPVIGGLTGLKATLFKSVNNEGKILDTASKELNQIRQRINLEEGTLRKLISKIYNEEKSKGHVPDGASIGIRDGRMVIPVVASNKRQVQGFVHDESASGNIVYLEPTVALEANNRIRELHIAEAREIRSILMQLTRSINEHRQELYDTNSFLAQIDFISAKAKLAARTVGELPKISSKKIDLKSLAHPLLILSNKKDKQVVSHNIKLDSDSRILLISGPNAGGKSVALKSVGLNQYMLQAGLLPCCQADSEFRIFSNLMIDIGDEQSIDNDLSTYSSHLRNMSVMLDKADRDSLILIDEFGSGTDPAFGGAIAEAMMGSFIKNMCYGVITTHFSNLKIFAEKTDGLINGAMVFDLAALKPLYRLDIGRPGSSFSLEVASQSGIPQSIITLAEAGIGANQIEIEKLLMSLEDERHKLQEKNSVLEEKERELTKLRNDFQQMKDRLEQRKNQIIDQAKEEATGLLAKTNREIEKTIRHIKENKAEKKETKKIRNNLRDYASRVSPPRKTVEGPAVKFEGGELKAGDHVLIVDKGVVAEVIEIKNKKAKILMGALQSVVAINELQKISHREAKREAGKGRVNISQSVNSKMVNFSPILDVRGRKADEVIPLIQRFLDEAIMLSQQSIKIIHGKGNGVLRQIIREELKNWHQVQSFVNEHVERGGDGATVIIMN